MLRLARRAREPILSQADLPDGEVVSRMQMAMELSSNSGDCGPKLLMVCGGGGGGGARRALVTTLEMVRSNCSTRCLLRAEQPDKLPHILHIRCCTLRP